MSQVTGKVQFIDANKFGYSPSLKVNGVKYGGDTRGLLPSGISQGTDVTFEAFETESNGKSYTKYKLQSLKVSTGPAPSAKSSATGVSAGTGSRDTYWSDKDAKDSAKEPRIVYLAAFERAVALATLVLAKEALPLPKDAKNRLDPILAFVDEQTQRILEATFAAKVPGATTAAEAPQDDESTDGADASDGKTAEEEWS